MMNQVVESKSQSNLDCEEKIIYKEKLMLVCEYIPDLYAVPGEEWADNVTKWPTVLLGDIYNYLIESKSHYRQQSLKGFKSLEAFILSVDMSGHVKTVLFYEPTRQSKFCALMAELVKSFQVTPTKPGLSFEGWPSNDTSLYLQGWVRMRTEATAFH